jgi:hypothetical protein
VQVGNKIKHISRDELGIGKVESINEHGVTVLFGNTRFIEISPNSIRLADKSDLNKSGVPLQKSKATSTNKISPNSIRLADKSNLNKSEAPLQKSKSTSTNEISPNSIRLADKSNLNKSEVSLQKPKSTSTNESSFAGRFLLYLIPAFIVVLIINQSAYGSCYSGYCLSAAFPRVLIISIIVSFLAAANSD